MIELDTPAIDKLIQQIKQLKESDRLLREFYYALGPNKVRSLLWKENVMEREMVLLRNLERHMKFDDNE